MGKHRLEVTTTVSMRYLNNIRCRSGKRALLGSRPWLPYTPCFLYPRADSTVLHDDTISCFVPLTPHTILSLATDVLHPITTLRLATFFLRLRTILSTLQLQTPLQSPSQPLVHPYLKHHPHKCLSLCHRPQVLCTKLFFHLQDPSHLQVIA